MAALNKPWIAFDPANPKRSKNINQDDWEPFRHLIIYLMEKGEPRQQILDVITGRRVGFHPSYVLLLSLARFLDLIPKQLESTGKADTSLEEGNRDPGAYCGTTISLRK
jgi:hypothetical protein